VHGGGAAWRYAEIERNKLRYASARDDDLW